MIQCRQEDYQELFINYTTCILRSSSSPNNAKQMIIRWRAQWVPPGSKELPYIPPPNNNNNGTTTMMIRSKNVTTIIIIIDGKKKRIVKSVKESIDIVQEADRNTLLNRKVAQEAVSCLDVSRRPPHETEEQHRYQQQKKQ